jgi:hypothetical protein
VQVGAVLNTTPQTNQQSTVANCVIHNNEITYIKNDAATMANGSLIATNYGAATDSIINNTVVNNKGTLIKNAGLNILSVATTVEHHFIINNVFYNNQRDGILSNLNGLLTLGKIANNMFNMGGKYFDNGTTIVSNDSTVGASLKTPNFKTPTSIIGNTTDGSSELSDWRITSGSYLIGKGITTSQLADKAGNVFAISRAVGAYEYSGLSGINEIKKDMQTPIVSVSNHQLISISDGKMDIFSVSGTQVWNGIVNSNQSILLPSGAYIVRLKTNQGNALQKVIL